MLKQRLKRAIKYLDLYKEKEKIWNVGLGSDTLATQEAIAEIQRSGRLSQISSENQAPYNQIQLIDLPQIRQNQQNTTRQQSRSVKVSKLNTNLSKTTDDPSLKENIRVLQMQISNKTQISNKSNKSKQSNKSDSDFGQNSSFDRRGAIVEKSREDKK